MSFENERRHFEETRTDPGFVVDQLEEDLSVSDELAEIFDQYSQALDVGDHARAEKVLAAHPEIEEFRTPLRGLYLLGREARQQKVESATEDSTIKKLGDFELGEELGRGGMGIVYAARQISLQRDVALKILPFTAVLDPRQVARFQNEAQAAASLHHPNIVPVYGVGCERGVHYYSMQLIKGQTIAQLIRQLRETRSENGSAETSPNTITNLSSLSTVASINSRAFVRNVANVGIKVAEAIHFAHEHGIIHRDIKPSNLLLDHSGTPWVADFGLARGRGTSNLTSHGDQLGTLRYMSPEQAAGRNHQVDFRTDVYSLGVTLYELLTLRPAFGENDRMKLVGQIESEQPVSMRTINPSIPFDLETIVQKAIDKNPQQRYASAGEMAADLKLFSEGKAIKARRKSVAERSIDVVVRNKRLSIAVVLGMVALTLTTSVLASVFYHQHQRAEKATAVAKFHLEQAHKAVDRFNALAADPSLSDPDSNSIRKKMASESIGYYRDFLGYAESNTGFEFEEAQTHARLADLLERIGDIDEAKEEFECSIELFERLDDERAVLERALGLNRLGLIQERSGKLSEAVATLKDSHEEFESLADRKVATIPRALMLANLASIEGALGDNGSAGKNYNTALDLLQGLTSADAIAARAKIASVRGAFLSATDPSRAISIIEASIEELEKAQSKLDPENTPSRIFDENGEHLTGMHNSLAVLYSKAKDFAKAEQHAQSAIKFWKEQRRRFPRRFDLLNRLATSLNAMGEIRCGAKAEGWGDSYFQQAEELFRQATSIRELPELQSRLASALHNRSFAAKKLGNIESARQFIAEAIELQEKALEMAPENSYYRRLWVAHQNAQDRITSSELSPVSTFPKDPR